MPYVTGMVAYPNDYRIYANLLCAIRIDYGILNILFLNYTHIYPLFNSSCVYFYRSYVRVNFSGIVINKIQIYQ